ncbi:hypothetical protein HPB50_029187 [Hyalomma asiaticum]|nr:hypothetical protein HPB50_029187 [Hyalomma asiaticum]
MQANVAKAVGFFCYSVATLALYRSSQSKRPERAKRREAEVFWTTDFRPSSRWDVNWDKQEPEYCVRPPLNSSEEEKRRYEADLKQAVATASRYLYLIRHGEFNYYEEQDKARTLTALGRKQADLTGQRLQQLGIPFSHLTHSTMTRAVETAEIIHQHLPQLPVFQCSLIREGEPTPPEPPFGIWKPQSKKQDSHEIIVCHANVIRYCICRALQIHPEAWSRMSLANCSISVVKIAPTGKVTLRALGDQGHLPVQLITTS